jgi:formylglycine-generating enzyme required for sulfatase activity
MLQGILPVVRNDPESAVVVKSDSMLSIVLCVHQANGRYGDFENKTFGFIYASVRRNRVQCQFAMDRQKQPNGYGLYDMLGNVMEWCSDFYGGSYYGASPAADPTGPSSGQERVLRGGLWAYGAQYSRASNRTRVLANVRLNLFGFRVCREKL